MKCKLCSTNKLSNEFPPETVNSECQHAALICLKCILQWELEVCPEDGCTCSILPERREWFQAIWDEYFGIPTYQDEEYLDIVPSSGHINVSLLNGDTTEINITENMSITKLKTEIKRKMGHEIGEQKLLYKGNEVEGYRKDSSIATIADYGIMHNSTVQLVKLLYSLPQSFDRVVFDLSWNYPSDVGVLAEQEKRDYLDASCFLFEGTKRLKVVDYVQNDPRMMAFMSKYKLKKKNWGVVHEGDKMDDRCRIGHHIIQVSIKEIPSEITHLFFTLSAWNSPTISRYPNPSLHFYDSNNPDRSLCDTTFTHAGDYQAVVMCCLSKSSSGQWAVYENGQGSFGNAKDYEPLEETIVGLIENGY